MFSDLIKAISDPSAVKCGVIGMQLILPYVAYLLH